MTDLRSHLERIPEDELLSLASLWLVRPDMPFNRQKVVQRLVGFFSSSTIRSRLMEGLDRNEAGIVTLVYVLGSASREGIAAFFAPKAHHVVDRDIDRLLKRTVLLLDEDGLLTLSSSLDYSGVVSLDVFNGRMRTDGRRIRLVETLKAMMSIVSASRTRNTSSSIRRLARSSAYVFPLLSQEEVVTLFEAFTQAALSRGLMKDVAGRIVIDRAEAEAFFSLPLVTIKACLLCGGTAHEDGIRLARLALLLDDGSACSLLWASRHGDGVDDLVARFMELRFIMGDDEEDTDASEVLVTDDLVVRTPASGRSVTPALFMSATLVDRIVTYQVSREAVEAGFDLGIDGKEMEEALGTASPLVHDRIAMWRERYDEFSFTRGIYLETSERNAKLISQLPLLRIHILRQVSPRAFLMKASSEEQWRRILVYSGFDMLPRTVGEDDAADDEAHGDGRAPDACADAVEVPLSSLAAKASCGDRSFTSALADVIAQRIDSDDRQAYMDMLDAGYILDEGQIVPGRTLARMRRASGFDHQAKLNLLSSAISEHGLLEISTPDGTMRAFVTMVETRGRTKSARLVDEDGDEHVIPVDRMFALKEVLS